MFIIINILPVVYVSDKYAHAGVWFSKVKGCIGALPLREPHSRWHEPHSRWHLSAGVWSSKGIVALILNHFHPYERPKLEIISARAAKNRVQRRVLMFLRENILTTVFNVHTWVREPPKNRVLCSFGKIFWRRSLMSAREFISLAYVPSGKFIDNSL